MPLQLKLGVGSRHAFWGRLRMEVTHPFPGALQRAVNRDMFPGFAAIWSAVVRKKKGTENH